MKIYPFNKGREQRIWKMPPSKVRMTTPKTCKECFVYKSCSTEIMIGSEKCAEYRREKTNGYTCNDCESPCPKNCELFQQSYSRVQEYDKGNEWEIIWPVDQQNQ